MEKWMSMSMSWVGADEGEELDDDILAQEGYGAL